MHDTLPAETTPQYQPKTLAPWWHTIVLIAILLGMSALGSLHSQKAGLGKHHVPQYVLTMGFEWALVGFCWIGLRIRRVPLKSLIGDTQRGFGVDLGIAAVFWVMSMAVLSLAAIALKLLHVGAAPTKEIAALAPDSPWQIALWVLLCVTAGVCEELIFRGYLLQQFASIRGQIWVGVLLSSLLFGASHGYEGLATMLVIALYGAMFCLLAVKIRSLRPGMIAHTWHDLFTGLALALAHRLHAI
jgi:membrane protease YdiL (CAAX protease family)